MGHRDDRSSNRPMGSLRTPEHVDDRPGGQSPSAAHPPAAPRAARWLVQAGGTSRDARGVRCRVAPARIPGVRHRGRAYREKRSGGGGAVRRVVEAGSPKGSSARIDPATRRTRAGRRVSGARDRQEVVVGVGAPLQVDRAAGGGGLAELQEAAVAELLLAEVRPGPGAAGSSARTAPPAPPPPARSCDHGAQQPEGHLPVAVLGQGHLRVALGRPFGQLDHVASARWRSSSPKVRKP